MRPRWRRSLPPAVSRRYSPGRSPRWTGAVRVLHTRRCAGRSPGLPRRSSPSSSTSPGRRYLPGTGCGRSSWTGSCPSGSVPWRPGSAGTAATTRTGRSRRGCGRTGTGRLTSTRPTCRSCRSPSRSPRPRKPTGPAARGTGKLVLRRRLKAGSGNPRCVRRRQQSDETRGARARSPPWSEAHEHRRSGARLRGPYRGKSAYMVG